MTIGASQEAKGSLTLVGTPIGNRADLSSRGLEALRQADTVLAEDTRVSGKLLSSLGPPWPTRGRASWTHAAMRASPST